LILKISTLYISQKDFMREQVEAVFPSAIYNPKGRHLDEDELVEFFSDADGVIVGMDPMTDAVMARLPKLKMIAKFGVGLDNIDLEAAERRGIAIGWTGGVNRRSVSEQTLCFMLGMMRNIFRYGKELKAGNWVKNGGFELTGKIVGIIGCGHIGTDLLRLLQPFGCRLLINDIEDRSLVATELKASQVDLETLFKEADVITVHVPLSPSTRGMFNRKRFLEMQEGAFFINTSRGEVVVQADLFESLRSGHLAGAALDVFEEEPPTDLDFLSLPTLWPTPHICGNSKEAVTAMLQSALNSLRTLED
jgi:phosphoglycerate dehydrogenase-like enzyme